MKINRELSAEEKMDLKRQLIDHQSQLLQHQKSGWITFFHICGALNLILCLIGFFLLLFGGRGDHFAAMNLTIIGLVAGINCFFLGFLIHTFTKIEHNTNTTAELLLKLYNK